MLMMLPKTLAADAHDARFGCAIQATDAHNALLAVGPASFGTVTADAHDVSFGGPISDCSGQSKAAHCPLL